MANDESGSGEMLKRVGLGAGLAIGMGVGVALGSAMRNMGAGIGLGVGIGAAVMIAFLAAGTRMERDAARKAAAEGEPGAAEFPDPTEPPAARAEPADPDQPSTGSGDVGS
ncbi:MAG: hypothetical protein JST33_10770 [Actinobacteria bacterium]|nr:hypothetical protein [Actinomycetota bacterium]